MSARAADAAELPDRVRIDVWLWRARFLKTRAAAHGFVTRGGVRLSRNGQTRRLEKPAVELAVGDTLVFALGGRVRTIRVCALGARRGPAAEARALYEDVSEDPNSESEAMT